MFLAASVSTLEGQPAGVQTREHENWGGDAADWTVAVPGRKPAQAGEHPRLVFTQADRKTIVERAETPQGMVMVERIAKQARDEISIGYGDRGYYFEGHQCGRISSNTGLIPFIQAYKLAAGKDLVSKNDNARWLAAKWIHEFAHNPDGSYTNAQRGMYCRNFPRGGMWSQIGDFALGFGICPPEYLPALKWVYNHQVEPGPEKIFDIIENPHTAIYALANWPLDVQERNPQEQAELLPCRKARHPQSSRTANRLPSAGAS